SCSQEKGDRDDYRFYEFFFTHKNILSKETAMLSWCLKRIRRHEKVPLKNEIQFENIFRVFSGRGDISPDTQQF
ncbi:MAG: hypothetical protein D3906_04965, partial [Candidatus Electrothrix sp. AUS1_2]|nr:hypothetical protein [Candidatus Electrothrix sp. AUS1_2]